MFALTHQPIPCAIAKQLEFHACHCARATFFHAAPGEKPVGLPLRSQAKLERHPPAEARECQEIAEPAQLSRGRSAAGCNLGAQAAAMADTEEAQPLFGAVVEAGTDLILLRRRGNRPDDQR